MERPAAVQGFIEATKEHPVRGARSLGWSSVEKIVAYIEALEAAHEADKQVIREMNEIIRQLAGFE